jgi:hypothetical protein
MYSAIFFAVSIKKHVQTQSHSAKIITLEGRRKFSAKNTERARGVNDQGIGKKGKGRRRKEKGEGIG